MKFKITAGKHIQTGSDGVERFYGPGDVVESDYNLTEKLGEKFVQIHEPGPDSYQPPPGFKLVPIDSPTSNPDKPTAGSVTHGETPAPTAIKPAQTHPQPIQKDTKEHQQHATLSQKEVFASLDKMPHKELLKVAQDGEIDVSDCKTREDCLKRIKASLSQ